MKLKEGLHAIAWEDKDGKDIDPSIWDGTGLRFIEPQEGIDYEHVYCHVEDDGNITVTVSIPAGGEDGGCIDVAYDPKELVEVFKQISEITGVYDMSDDGHRKYFLLENLDLKIDPLKYPNGAMRGLIIAPEYPDGYIDACKPLRVNHVRDYVYEYVVDECCGCMTDDGYKPRERENEQCACNNDRHEDALSKNLRYKRYSMQVLCAHQSMEEKRLSGLNFNCGKLGNEMVSPSNDFSFQAQIAPYQHYEDIVVISADDSWTDRKLNDAERFSSHPEHHRDTHDRRCDKNYMGMYGYLRWVENNDMWVPFKTFYGIIAGTDSLDSNEENLVRSVYIFNPNDIPIKCNYMIFS